MEPVTTKDGYNMLQNPGEARDLLGDYYKSLGFHVVKTQEETPASPNGVSATANPPR